MISGSATGGGNSASFLTVGELRATRLRTVAVMDVDRQVRRLLSYRLQEPGQFSQLQVTHLKAGDRVSGRSVYDHTAADSRPSFA